MDVVGHQDIGIEAEAVALAVVLDALEVDLSVVVIIKSPLALVAEIPFSDAATISILYG
jgi:hypothetical protein